MKLSEQWLREWVDPPVGTAELAAQLTGAGFEVESVAPVAGDLGAVVVGELLAVNAHPGADRLSVCRVAAGAEAPRTVVCGAPNVYAGMRAPFVPPGARLPDGTKIRRSRIRGVVSEGMLCSAKELGLGEDADGILDLGADAPAGAALAELLQLDDASLDVAVMPNRGDCLGLAGLAREVGVLNRCEVRPPPIEPVLPVIEDAVEVRLESPPDCPLYVGRVIRDVDPGARTPLWMRERLRRSGLRPISPVVDVTHYVMLELGQPMHAFDLDTLDTLVRVRKARAGERLVMLDGRDIELRTSTLVIADAARARAIGGVMGGLDSGVSGRTRNVFLEAAFFAPHLLAGEARAYGLVTDASFRFERGVAPGLQRGATERATALLLDIMGGRPGPLVETAAQSHLPERAPVRLRAERIRKLLGMEVEAATVREVLTRLGLEVAEVDGGWRVTPPPFRFDVSIEADLIEEIARVVGYDRVPSHRPRARLPIAARPEHVVPLARLRAALVERGYHEAISYSFVDSRLQALADPEVPPIPLANPISSDLTVMRTTLLPGLLQALLRNAKRQRARIRLFESGVVFAGDAERPLERRRLAGIASGPVLPEQWGTSPREVDFFDLRSDVEALLAAGGAARAASFEAAGHPAFHPGLSARVRLEGEPVGVVGALHPRIGAELKLGAGAFAFELDLARLEQGRVPAYRAISRFPLVRRDISIVVDERISAAALRDCVGQVGIDVLKDLELFDVYRGEGIDSGKKSITLGLTFQAPSRTLEDAEVDAFMGDVRRALERELHATLRG